MIVHLYTSARNEMRMLPFFFRHYDAFVTRYLIADDGSTGGTREYLARRSNVEVTRMERVDPDSYVACSLHFYETGWRRSRGAADWVIVTNIDEHLFHPRMVEYLQEQQRAGVTAVPALGYQMLATRFPEADRLLSRDLTRGAPWKQMSKLDLFRPDRIEAVNYSPGRHTAAPAGDVVYPERDELLNLHYKYLGMDYILDRHAAAQSRRGPKDIANRWGHRYGFSADEVRADWDDFAARSVDIAAVDPVAVHAEPRWWRRPPAPDKGA